MGEPFPRFVCDTVVTGQQLRFGLIYRLFAESYRQRREAARRMRKNTLHAVETAFNGYLHQRGFTGSMKIDLEAHTLHLQVLHLSWQKHLSLNEIVRNPL